MDYETAFRQQALHGFTLSVDDYIDTFDDISDWIDGIKRCASSFASRNEWKKAIERMVKEKDKIEQMCNNPTALTIEEQQSLRDIKDYLKANAGHLSGYYSYRKKKTQQVIEEFKEISLANRMILIANKETIDNTINKYIKFYTEKYELSRLEYQKVRKQDIKDWGTQYYTCECGMNIQRVSKARHEKTDQHVQYMRTTYPNKDFCEVTKNVWYKEKYKCICGKIVSRGNKSTHEKTKYHQQYQPTCNETIPIVEQNSDCNKPNNIILTIAELAMDEDLQEISQDDDSFKYF